MRVLFARRAGGCARRENRTRTPASGIQNLATSVESQTPGLRKTALMHPSPASAAANTNPRVRKVHVPVSQVRLRSLPQVVLPSCASGKPFGSFRILRIGVGIQVRLSNLHATPTQESRGDRCGPRIEWELNRVPTLGSQRGAWPESSLVTHVLSVFSPSTEFLRRCLFCETVASLKVDRNGFTFPRTNQGVCETKRLETLV